MSKLINNLVHNVEINLNNNDQEDLLEENNEQDL